MLFTRDRAVVAGSAERLPRGQCNRAVVFSRGRRSACAVATLAALTTCGIVLAWAAHGAEDDVGRFGEHPRCQIRPLHGVAEGPDAPRFAVAAGALCSALLAAAMHFKHAASSASAAARDVLRLLSSVAVSIYAWLRREAVVRPLRSLYMKGFGWGSVGGWGGASPAHICASLTAGSNPAFWSSTPEAVRECDAMIEKRYQSVLVVVEYVMLIYVLLRVLGLVASHVAVVNPVVREMRALRREIGCAAAGAARAENGASGKCASSGALAHVRNPPAHDRDTQ